jgi:hypothetical protein
LSAVVVDLVIQVVEEVEEELLLEPYHYQLLQ